jgi:hypothetical protein
MRKLLYIAIAMLGFQLLSPAQTVTSNLSEKEIRIGQQATITLEARFPAASKEILLPALKDTLSKYVEIVEIGEPDTAFDEDDITTKIITQQITVTSWDSGFHAIPPFLFRIGADSLKTEPLLLSVKSVQVDPQADIKDIKPIEEVPFSLWDWIQANKNTIGLVLILLLLVIGILVWYRKYKNRPKEEAAAVVPQEKADVVALRKLKELQAKKLWQNGKIKAYYVELSYILREYLENRYRISALESTTDEILILSRSHTTDEDRKKLHQVLLLADMAKYARQNPVASENEQAMKQSLAFVEATKMEEKEEENPSVPADKVATETPKPKKNKDA